MTEHIFCCVCGKLVKKRQPYHLPGVDAITYCNDCSYDKALYDEVERQLFVEEN